MGKNCQIQTRSQKRKDFSTESKQKEESKKSIRKRASEKTNNQIKTSSKTKKQKKQNNSKSIKTKVIITKQKKTLKIKVDRNKKESTNNRELKQTQNQNIQNANENQEQKQMKKINQQEKEEEKQSFVRKDELIIPEHFYCPIGKQIMIDPVISVDGHSYERKNIQQWYYRNSTSPIFGLKVQSTSLIPNHSLRNLIQDFLVQNPNASKQLQIEQPNLNQIQYINNNYAQHVIKTSEEEIQKLRTKVEKQEDQIEEIKAKYYREYISNKKIPNTDKNIMEEIREPLQKLFESQNWGGVGKECMNQIINFKKKYNIPYQKHDDSFWGFYDFSYLVLKGYNLSNVHPKYGTFLGCDLSNCIFPESLCCFIIRHAILKDADFTQTHFYDNRFDIKGANFTGANFGQQGLEKKVKDKLVEKGAIFDN